ncbi:hypothetical protein CAL29_17010 [Bordetella genomosp. 10]|uniref:DUF7822 domain-containing protein n=1 Tax=Bordetella genomosp. 10 TaxID=1416804 RepID=A0A261RXJ4_9BORD|nr:hypothetical protein [Bordetella genomosp. 10]OZI29809.1 hypothetical protein CAL29_17010 [Bordetella genomosp. 10]
MANRSYLYSLDNRPASYEDRPETIRGLSEWPYDVPFMYRLLMSADPRICSTLISDGLDGSKTPLHAISAPFDEGLERVRRFVAVVKTLIAEPEAGRTAETREESGKPTLAARMRQWLGLSSASAAQPAPAAAPSSPETAPAAIEHLPAWLDETVAFLEAHRDRYLLLETIELDIMSESDPDALRAMVEAEIERCRRVGEGYAALPDDVAEAARVLRRAAAAPSPAPLDVFHGLRFDDACDHARSGHTEYPLGLEWTDVLYFQLSNREEFEAAKRQPPESESD